LAAVGSLARGPLSGESRFFSSEGVICSQLSGDFTELVQGSSDDDFLRENIAIGTIFLALKAFNDLNGLNGLNRRLVSRPMRRIRAFHLAARDVEAGLSRLLSASSS
jgi:hypothetical protein